MNCYLLSVILSIFFIVEYSLASCVIAIKCMDGIAIGSDTQSTSPGMIGNRETKKVFLLSENTVMCCGNGVLDFHKLHQELAHEIRMNNLLYESTLDVEAIAKFARQIINRKYKSAHVLIAGLTKNSLPKIYEITPGGSCFEQDYAVAGSCSSSLYPLLEQFCKGKINPNGKESKDTLTQISGSNTQLTHTKDFDPFTLQPMDLSQSVILTLTSDKALTYLQILLNYAMKMDPQSGGRLCKWMLCKREGLKRITDVTVS